MTLPASRRLLLPYLETESAAVAYVDERVDGDGILLDVDSTVSVSALSRAEAADRFYGIQMEMFSEGDLHGW